MGEKYPEPGNNGEHDFSVIFIPIYHKIYHSVDLQNNNTLFNLLPLSVSFLTAFSLITNWERLSSVNSEDDEVSLFHGIKALAMTGIIFRHRNIGDWSSAASMESVEKVSASASQVDSVLLSLSH